MMIGARTAAWAKAGRSYPWDYRLDWLETSTEVSQRIKLWDSKPRQGMRFVGKVRFLQISSNNANRIPFICGGYENSPFNGFQLSTGYNGLFFLRFGPNTDTIGGFSGAIQLPEHTVDANVDYEIDAKAETGGIWIKIDGVTKFSATTSRTDFGSHPFYVYDGWNATTFFNRRGIRHYGKWEFYVEGNVEKSIIPCVKDGVVCVYDEINDEFLFNSGTGNLTAGPRVNDDGTPL